VGTGICGELSAPPVRAPALQGESTEFTHLGSTPQYARARPRLEKTITTIGHLGEARDRLTVSDAQLENHYDERYDSEPDPDGHAVCTREANTLVGVGHALRATIDQRRDISGSLDDLAVSQRISVTEE
jgi:hypothetical protein